MVRRIETILLALLLLLTRPGHAAEYFVSRGGADTNDGRSRGAAFGALQRGVDALQPGDILTILPGEYHEVVTRADLGAPDTDTVIRAELPQTVLLRGDVPAPAFRKLPGFRFVYVADFVPEATAINEADTLRILESVPNVQEVEFSPGTFYQDRDAGRLYISSSDLQPPQSHHYTVGVLKGRGGMHLVRPQRVILDGIAATGYNTNVRMPRLSNGNSASDCIPWGLFLSNPTRCLIRNCVAYLNAGGIAVQSGTAGSNLIEHCTGYGNSATHSSEGGNILAFNPNHDVIRDCYAYVGDRNGIRLYNDSPDPVGLLQNCLAWGHQHADIHVKAGPVAMARNCVGLRNCSATNKKVYDSLSGRPMGSPPEQNNIVLSDEQSLDLNTEFADPDNLDFRLQPASRFRATGPDGRDRGPYPYEATVFYVTPDGSDAADGLSVSNAWRTITRAARSLPAGSTLYLLPGAYEGDVTLTLRGSETQPIAIRGRGTDPVVLRGAFHLVDSSHITIERVGFEGAVSCGAPRATGPSAALSFRNCRFTANRTGLTAHNIDGLTVAHCEFSGFTQAALALPGCRNVDLRGNRYENSTGVAVQVDDAAAIRYSDYNGYRDNRAAWRFQEHGSPEPSLSALESRPPSPRTGHFDTHSVDLATADPVLLLSAGPLGTALGVHEERQRFNTDTVRVVGPLLHAVADTTANIEWWSSQRAIFDVAWGETPDCTNRMRITPATAYHPGSPLRPFNTFSMTGLKPNHRYFFRITGAWMHDDPSVPAAVPDNYREPIDFTTAAQATIPRTYYVATDGCDGNSGVDRANAWRTINHAAGSVLPGDTVLIAGGIYYEHVRVRVTGDAGRPITFRSIPGEKVTLDGANKTLVAAFTIANKAHVKIDGLYFRNHQRRNTIGMIRVSRVDDLSVTRCFQDGRGSGYDPEFLTAGLSRNLLVKNCVMMSGWDGLAAGNSTNVRIENNVIVRPLIRAVCIAGGRNVRIANNIITDNLAVKHSAWLLAGTAHDAAVANNCFYLRVPESERPVFGSGRDLMADYDRIKGVKEPNLVADPRFAGLRQGGESFAETSFFSDRFLSRFNDFPDLFATNPELVRRGIGLEPDAFREFHFGAGPE